MKIGKRYFDPSIGKVITYLGRGGSGVITKRGNTVYRNPHVFSGGFLGLGTAAKTEREIEKLIPLDD